MKKITLSYSYNLIALFFISNIASAQVGINTTDPKGVIDFNSTNMGVVYPNVALLGTDDATTVVNPQGGPIVEGTVVYNTNATNLGLTTDIYPGIYVWDGTEWVVHYKKRQSELHNQTALLRTEANFPGDWQDVPGLGIADAKTFTAKYSGLYRIEVKTNFAGGRTETNSSIFVSMASGQFRFLFDGTAYPFETTAFSAFSSYINSGTYYEGIWKESYETNYVNLIAGQTYPFSLCFDAYDAPGFIGNGSTAPGTPIPVELVNEDFEGAMIGETNNGDAQCSPAGWAINNPNPCTACTTNHLYISGEPNNCTQNATAFIGFTPTVASVDISFDYLHRDVSGKNDSFRVYLRNESTLVETSFLVVNNTGNSTTNTSYSGNVNVTPNIAHTIRFEYKNGGSKAGYTSVDNVLITEPSGPIGPTVYTGRGYVGNEVNCQIEFTYIGE